MVNSAVYSKLDADLQAAVTQVLSSMVNLEASAKDKYEGTPKRFNVDLSGVIGITAPGLSGAVAIHCDFKLAHKITSILLCSDMPENTDRINDEVRDAFGELVNVIVGSFKVALSSFIGHPAQMTIPTVIVGHTHSTHICGGGEWRAIMFDVSGERLLVECQLIYDKN